MILKAPLQLECVCPKCVGPGFVPALSMLCQVCAELSGLEMEGVAALCFAD